MNIFLGWQKREGIFKLPCSKPPFSRTFGYMATQDICPQSLVLVESRPYEKGSDLCNTLAILHSWRESVLETMGKGEVT